MKYSKLRTQPIKGLLIFLIVTIIVSAAVLAYFIYDTSTIMVSIAVYIFCSIFIVFGFIVLIDQLFHYVEVKENTLVNHFLFTKSVLSFDRIKKIVLVNEMYIIYSKKKKFCTMPSRIRGSNEIIVYLEKHGISISEPDKKI